MNCYTAALHTTADDAGRYQPEDEVALATPKEPISRLKHYLIEQGFWTEAEDQALLAEASQNVQDEVDVYLNRQPQKIASAFDFHYQDLPDYLIEQRANAMEEETHA